MVILFQLITNQRLSTSKSSCRHRSPKLHFTEAVPLITISLQWWENRRKLASNWVQYRRTFMMSTCWSDRAKWGGQANKFELNIANEIALELRLINWWESATAVIDIHHNQSKFWTFIVLYLFYVSFRNSSTEEGEIFLLDNFQTQISWIVYTFFRYFISHDQNQRIFLPNSLIHFSVFFHQIHLIRFSFSIDLKTWYWHSSYLIIIYWKFLHVLTGNSRITHIKVGLK